MIKADHQNKEHIIMAKAAQQNKEHKIVDNKIQTWFYEDNKKAKIGKIEYWVLNIL